MDNSRPSISKAERSRSNPITGAELCEIVNDSDSDGYELECLDELEETDYFSGEQEITLPEPQPEQEITPPETQPERGQKRKRQATRLTTDKDLEWKQNIYTANKPKFSGQLGLNPNLEITEDNSPTDVFNLFFDNGIIAEIQSETNRYAKQQINIRKQAGPLKPKYVYAQWKEVSLHETKIFLAIVIHMCLVKKPSLSDYWTTQPVLHTNYTTKVGMS
jgi:hypothetical protein